MQLRLDAADRLVELVEEQGGVLPVEEAARSLFALSRAPAGLARDLLADIVAADSRLDWSGRSVGLAGSQLPALPLEAATYVVVDLETTGLAPGRARICEIGAVRVRGLELAAAFESLVDPAMALPASITALTGISDADLQGAPSPGAAVSRFLDFAGDCVLVAHNARFDVGFLNHEVERLVRTAARFARPGHGLAGAPAPCGPRRARKPFVPGAFLRHLDGALPPGAT